jgi:galactoside O-acetyltransferase
VHFGSGIYCNSNVTFVDDADIYVGDHTMIAPNVVITTSGHPVLPILREHNYVFNISIHIGKNVFIGSGVQILPGVTIGDNSVIGAGSVVSNDIPANVIAMGVPCRVIREIGEKDKKYYYKKRELDVSE